MRPRILLAAAVAAVLVVAAGAVAYAYFFSGLRAAPRPLALASPPPASAVASPTAGGSLAGAWTLASGGKARFRVNETVAGVPAHEAVAETADVAGGLTLVPSGTDYQASGIRVTVGLTGLHSIDTLAGRNVAQRDGIVQRALATGQFPQAVFQAGSVTVPGTVADGRPVTLTVPGQLTVHGVTRDVQAIVELQVSGTAARAVGRIKADMRDFGVQPPQAPGIVPEAATTLEFESALGRS